MYGKRSLIWRRHKHATRKYKEELEALYGIELRDGVVWIRHVEVGNTVFVKQ